MAAAAAAAPVGDDEVAMPDAARAEPKFAAVYEALAARRKAGVTYVVNEATGCLALEPKADFVDTYGHVFEADLKDPDGVPTLWLICKLPKEDGVVCNRATQVSRVDGGAIKIKSGNVADHLLTHGMSANLTPSHQQKVRDAKAAKAGAKRAKPSSGGASGADASPGGAGANAGAEQIVAAGGGAAPSEKQIVGWIVRMCSMGALPFNIVNNMGFRYLMSKMRLPMPNYTAVRRQFLKDVDVVEDEMRSNVNKMVTQVTYHSGGFEIMLKPQVQYRQDCWRAGNGANYSSATLCVGMVTNMNGSLQLRPKSVLIDMRQIAVDVKKADQKKDAEYMAGVHVTHLQQAGVDPRDVFLYTADTTNLSYASIQHDIAKRDEDGEFLMGKNALGQDVNLYHELSSWGWGPCGLHEINSSGKTMYKKSKEAKYLLDCAHEFSAFWFSADAKMDVLVGIQREMGVSRPLKPILKGETRFMYALIQQHRLLDLDDACEAVRTKFTGAGAPAAPAWFGDFCEQQDKWRALRTKARALDSMFTPILKLYSQLGSDLLYTVPMRMPFFMKVDEIVAPFVAAGSPIKQIADEFLKDFYRRWAPLVILADKSVVPRGTKKLTAHEKKERLHWDTLTNLGSALDPASWHRFNEQAGNWDDALAHSKVIMRRWVDKVRYVHGGGAGAAGRGGMLVEQGETRVQVKQRIIAGRPPKGKFESKEVYDKETDRLVMAALQEWDRAHVGAGAGARAGAGAGVVDSADTELLGCLEKEWASYKAYIDAEVQDYRDKLAKATAARAAAAAAAAVAAAAAAGGVGAGVGAAPPPLPEWQYGDVFDDNKLRMTFWVKHMTQWPLLFCVARSVLCASLTQVKNERVHSVGGIICQRLRASVGGGMLRSLIMAHQTLREVTNDTAFVHSLGIVGEEDAIFFAGEGEGDLLGEGKQIIPAVDYGEDSEEGDDEEGMA